MSILLIQYLILSLVIIISSTRISCCLDELDRRTNIAGALLGSVLFAGITSLPELITSVTSITILNNPDLAIGNILGSNAFNLLILAIGDIIFFKRHLFNHTRKMNAKTNLINTLIYLLILLSLFHVFDRQIAHIGITSLFIIILYYLNVRLVSDEPIETCVYSPCNSRLSKLIAELILFSILIVGSSLYISVVTNQIAKMTIVGSSFIGAIFLGIATSLPEMTTLISLVRLRNYDLAVGNIIGSNLFNFAVIALSDALYLPGSIFNFVDTSNGLLIVVGLFESIILTYMLIRQEVRQFFLYLLPSLLIIGIYLTYLFISLNNG